MAQTSHGKIRWITRDGLHLKIGGKPWKWFKANEARIEGHGNPAPIKGKKPVAKPASVEQQIVAYAHTSLTFAGKMVYSEGSDRSMLFGRKPGDFDGAHADCSQYCASILHWLGNQTVTDTDYTGTLLEKGKLLKGPRVGCVAIWGPGTGAHAAFITGKVGASDWMTIGFGHQGAPDRNLLSGMNKYFDGVGQPGVRFLSFT